jgi:hypothetical protein
MGISLPLGCELVVAKIAFCSRLSTDSSGAFNCIEKNSSEVIVVVLFTIDTSLIAVSLSSVIENYSMGVNNNNK